MANCFIIHLNFLLFFVAFPSSIKDRLHGGGMSSLWNRWSWVSRLSQPCSWCFRSCGILVDILILESETIRLPQIVRHQLSSNGTRSQGQRPYSGATF